MHTFLADVGQQHMHLCVCVCVCVCVCSEAIGLDITRPCWYLWNLDLLVHVAVYTYSTYVYYTSSANVQLEVHTHTIEGYVG